MPIKFSHKSAELVQKVANNTLNKRGKKMKNLIKDLLIIEKETLTICRGANKEKLLSIKDSLLTVQDTIDNLLYSNTEKKMIKNSIKSRLNIVNRYLTIVA